MPLCAEINYVKLHKMSTIVLSKKITLSDYYPADCVYFYGFPTGEDSCFYNEVSPFDEELVSGRSLICAGDSMKVLVFAASADASVTGLLSKHIAICNESNILKLPGEISAYISGNKRNELIKSFIHELAEDGRLIMAQPFLDEKLDKKFKISPKLIVTLNDKKNRNLYIPGQCLPRIYATFTSGKAFSQATEHLPLPCVIKVTSSSSGNGVQICNEESDVAQAKKRFGHIRGDIFVEEYIQFKHSVCIQVGIPYNTADKPTIIGYNESLISPSGDFLAGIVNHGKQIPYLHNATTMLIEEILPKIRNLGWYGIAGIEVLIKADGTFYFVDPNFRLTATYPYIFLTHLRKISSPIVSVSGMVSCTPSEFEDRFLSPATTRDSFLTVVSLTKHRDEFRFNAGIQFESIKDLQQKANELVSLGVESHVLRNIMQPGFRYSLD